jgi:hypothetical protein
MTMRCADVIEELAIPAPRGADPAALADHLAQCPRCAAWARRDAKLARLWDATRPEEPSALTWATMWDQVVRAVESDAIPRSSPATQSLQVSWGLSSRPRPWRALTLFAMAQAAVLLVGTWVAWRSNVVRPSPWPASRPKAELIVKAPDPSPSLALGQASEEVDVDIECGATVVIRSGVTGMKIETLASNEGSGAVNPMFGALGIFEAMAE